MSNSRRFALLGIACFAFSSSLPAQAPSAENDTHQAIAQITLRPSVRGQLALELESWDSPGSIALTTIRRATLPCNWAPEVSDEDFVTGTCRNFFSSDGTSAWGKLDLAGLVLGLHAAGIPSVRVLLEDYRRELAQAPPGWTVETSEQRAKKRKGQRVDRSSGPTYWFISEDYELPSAFELRMGTPWSALPVAVPFALTLFGPGLLALWLRRRAERRGATQAAAVWVGWILNATWLYWIFSASPHGVADLLAHWKVEAVALNFVLGAVLMALPPLVAVASCTAVLLRDPGGDPNPRDTAALVKRAVGRESVLMVPLCIFMGGAGAFEQNLKLSAIGLVVAFVIYRLLSVYVGRWISRGAEILTHGELMEASSAIAARAGVTLSSIYVFGSTDEREVNAFAGRGRVMAVTRGLVQHLTRRELNAVIGHEIGHLRGKHVAMSSIAFWAYILLAQPLTLVLVNYAHIPAAWLVTMPILPIGYIFAVSFLSRKNEFQADARAADLTGDPEAMIAALARLRMLTRTPIAWGGIQGSILSHPSMRDRVLAIARHSGLPEDRALALLENPDLLQSGDEPEMRHFPLPVECAGATTAFSSNAKMSYLFWVGWAEQVLVVALCLGVSVFAERVWPGWPFAILLVLACIPVIAAAFLITSNWFGRIFVRSRRALVARSLGARAAGGTFAGLLPGPLAAPVEGFYQWDMGFFWLTADALIYRGERTSFSLPRSDVRAVSVVKGPLAWDRAHLVRLDCDLGSLQLSRPDVGTLPHHAERLAKRINLWRQDLVQDPDPGPEPAPLPIVWQPASAEWLRGLAAVRFHLKRAFFLFLGVTLLEPLAQNAHMPGVTVLPLIAPISYMAINLPYLFRPKPQLRTESAPEAAPVLAHP